MTNPSAKKSRPVAPRRPNTRAFVTPNITPRILATCTTNAQHHPQNIPQDFTKWGGVSRERRAYRRIRS